MVYTKQSGMFNNNAMKKKLIYGGMVIVAVAGLWWFVHRSGSGNTQEVYERHIVEVGNVHAVIDVDATVRPRVYSDVAAELSPRIVWVGADVNDHVTKGQVLVRLERGDIDAKIRHAQLAVERAELAENQGRHKSSGLSSREILSLKKASEQARQKLRELLAHARKTVITSPINGVIVAQNAHVGNIAQGVLMRIIDPATLQIEALVPEVDIAKVRSDARATIKFDAYPGVTLKGYVQTVDVGSTHLQNNTYYKAVIVRDDNDDDIVLRDGMSADIDIEYARRDGVTVVPRDFAFKDEHGYFVYVLNSNDSDIVLAKKYFHEGLIGDAYVEVVQGLTRGQEIVKPHKKGI